MIDYQSVLNDVAAAVSLMKDKGEICNFIPNAHPENIQKFAICLTTINKQCHSVGDINIPLSIQSIGKVLSLTLALTLEGDKLWHRLGVEPSGTAYNALYQLEQEKGIPRNPFINPGALVICDILVSHFPSPKTALLDFIRDISGDPELDYNPEVARAEQATSFVNAALINLMKSFGSIHNTIETVLDLYFHLCSIEMTTETLSQTFLYLAASGTNPFTRKTITTDTQAKRINAIMQTCGFYDEAGEFAYKVGLPGKSGVGGGIIAIHPDRYSIAVWSPKLNQKGNSYKGMKALELFTSKTRSSIF